MLNEGNSKKLKKAKKLARKPDVVPLSPIGDLVFLYVQMPFQISILFFEPFPIKGDYEHG